MNWLKGLKTGYTAVRCSWSNFTIKSSRKHSYLCNESPEEMILLVFVWDETASGIGRSNAEKGLHSWSAPQFCMVWDCFWDSKEQHRECTDQLICSSFMHGTRIISTNIPIPRGGLVNDKTASGRARSNTEDRLHSWSAPPFIILRSE